MTNERLTLRASRPAGAFFQRHRTFLKTAAGDLVATPTGRFRVGNYRLTDGYGHLVREILA